MKNKIGTARCFDCDYADCDVGTDKKGHPYMVCWGECAGSQFFTHGKKPRVRSLLKTYKPIEGKPTADELRAQYELLPVETPAPAPAPAPVAQPAPAKPKAGATLLG